MTSTTATTTLHVLMRHPATTEDDGPQMQYPKVPLGVQDISFFKVN